MDKILFQSLGGLGMFLVGMKIMSEGLQKVAGKKMRQILNIVSSNRLVGCGIGALVTGIIQSSSATTVMLVGFVDAGLMTLTQAVGIILGANIGTTITAQLIAFDIAAYALPAIAAGAFLKFFIENQKWKYIGDVLIGFGLVFFGLATMKAGFAPFRNDPGFISFFTRFNAETLGGIFLCVLVGTVLTMILQSSSATIGITMALAMQGLLDFEASVALIMGENIGTTITAQLASIGSTVSARQTANAHTLFNVIGVFIIIAFFPFFLKLVTFITSNIMMSGPPDLLSGGEKPNIARYIANSHTLFNLVNAIIFLVILPYLVKMSVLLTPSNKKGAELEDLHHIKYLDTKFVDAPLVAITQARAEILRMGKAVEAMFDSVIDSFKERNVKELSKWKKQEDALDILQREITQFLVTVMQKNIMPEESKEVTSLMRMTNNFERTGDSIENIAQLMEELIEQNLFFSEEGINDFDTITSEVREFVKFVVTSVQKVDKNVMSEAERLEANINRMTEEMKDNHIMRLQSGICTVDPGLILVDMLMAFEKIGDYCFNIAQAVAGVK